MKRHALILAVCLLSSCAPPDRWNAGYSHEAATGALPARDIYSAGVSGPLRLPGETREDFVPASMEDLPAKPR